MNKELEKYENLPQEDKKKKSLEEIKNFIFLAEKDIEELYISSFLKKYLFFRKKTKDSMPQNAIKLAKEIELLIVSLNEKTSNLKLSNEQLLEVINRIDTLEKKVIFYL